MTGVVSTNPPNYGAASTNQGYSLTPQGGLRTQAMAGGADVSPTNPLPVEVVSGSGSQVTILSLDVSTVTTGGTPVTALSAGHATAGGWIQNPPTATTNLGSTRRAPLRAPHPPATRPSSFRGRPINYLPRQTLYR